MLINKHRTSERKNNKKTTTNFLETLITDSLVRRSNVVCLPKLHGMTEIYHERVHHFKTPPTKIFRFQEQIYKNAVELLFNNFFNSL